MWMKTKTYFMNTQSTYVNVWVWILAFIWESQRDGACAFSVKNCENLGVVFFLIKWSSSV